MTPQRKKQLIAGLLFVSCLVGAWLLFIIPANQSSELHNFNQADSLLQLTLADFNIPQSRISTHTSRLDSNFSRKTYTIPVAPGFSKTQFHSVLQRRLSPYQISLPAKMIFPEKDMHIFLDYNNTIFRTVQLVTDEDLSMKHSFAHIIVAMNHQPENELLQRLTSIGEPIPLAVIIKPPYKIPGWMESTQKIYSPLYLWLKTSDGDNVLGRNTSSSVNEILKTIHEDITEPVLLNFYQNRKNATERLEDQSVLLVDAADATLFNDEMQESEFRQTFRQFVQQARSGGRPLAIITGSDKTLQWLQNELNTFKKGGLFIMPPPKTHF